MQHLLPSTGIRIVNQIALTSENKLTWYCFSNVTSLHKRSAFPRDPMLPRKQNHSMTSVISLHSRAEDTNIYTWIASCAVMALSEVQEKADVALKPIMLSVTLASWNENICCEKKSSRRMRVMSIAIKTTQKSNSKAPKQIIAGIHEAAVWKWFGGGGQVRTTSLHKILKSWSTSTLWKPQKWAAFSYMETLLALYPTTLPVPRTLR